MTLQISRTDATGPEVSEKILGHNIEMCLTTAHGFLSDCLRNPKFTGPPHRMTGLAPEWQGASMGQAFYELTPGAGLLGSTAQLVNGKNGSWGPHLHQNKLQLRAGQTLELEIWARARHDAVKLAVSLQPVAARAQPHDRAEIIVETPYYKRYTATLTGRFDDDEARLSITLPAGGEVWFDQIHLRPQDQPLLCRELVDEMSRMRIPTLRFPGGIVVNCYNWKHGTGPVHLRPHKLEAAFHQDWELNYDFGLDEYLQLALEQNITPALTLNVATGTPDEATELAAYCREWFERAGVTPPLIYWHIGNHPYHDTTAHMTPAMYVDVLRNFVPAVRNTYPDNRIVAVMSRAALVGEGPPKQWKEALFTVPDLIDVVEFQDYGGCDPEAAGEPQLQALADKLSAFTADTETFIGECRSRRLQWRIGVAEWNWWLQASHWDGRAFEEPPTVLHGLFIAGMIHRFARLAPDFEVAHFYNLVNCMGILNHRGTDVEVTDSVRVFNLYRPALPGKRIHVEIGEAPENVDILAVDGADADWLFLVNRTHNTIAPVVLDRFETGKAHCECLAGTRPVGAFQKREINIADGRLEIPPLSICRLRMPN